MAVSYFTAVIAADGNSWRTRDVDIEDAASLEDLADTLHVVGFGKQPVLAVIEHEDEWFALVRVDGDDEPRVFVSDLAAASRGAFAELLSPAGDVDTPEGEDDPDGAGPAELDDPDDLYEIADPDDEVPGVEAEEEVDLGDLDEEDPEPPPPWAGHLDLLTDLGVGAGVLVELCEEHSDDPAGALAEVGELAGFSDLLEALR